MASKGHARIVIFGIGVLSFPKSRFLFRCAAPTLTKREGPALAALGLYMVTLPDVGFNTKKVTLVLYHKEFGLLVLVLLAMRLAWRVTHILPRLVEHLPDWQKIAARFVHLSFYALIFTSHHLQG
jgi:hypothetical protein